jgi:predicted alpha/beta superfamily hydrolase
MIATNQSKIDQFELPHPSGEGSLQISVMCPPALTGDLTDAPVLYVIDADFEYATAAEIARLTALGGTRPSAIVVGIGYGTDDFLKFMRLRAADLTPPVSDDNKKKLGKFTLFIGEESGGADALLTFLTDTLVPEIARRYPQASKDNKALYGHSLGGLFAAHALLTRPDSFNVFLPASPSLWWNGFAILDLLSGFTAKLDDLYDKPRVLVTVGGTEQNPPAGVLPGSPFTLEEMQAMIDSWRTVDAAAEFADALREAGLTNVNYVAFADENHESVIPASMTRSLNFFLAQPDP